MRDNLSDENQAHIYDHPNVANGKIYFESNGIPYLPTRSGYTFAGWRVSSGWSSVTASRLAAFLVKTDGSSHYVDEPTAFPIILTVQWSAVDSGGSDDFGSGNASGGENTAADPSTGNENDATDTTPAGAGSASVETTTNADGSTTVTETASSTETTTGRTTNADGSTTETAVTSAAFTVTTTASDGSSVTTATKTDSTTATTSVASSDGTTTATAVTNTTEKTTATVKAADGMTTTAVTETTGTKTVATTVGADGKTTGSGTVSTTSTITASDGSVSTTVTEGAIVVDTDARGTISEVTMAKTTTTAAETTDGSTGTVVEDERGNLISAKASVSAAAMEAALESGTPINVPVTVEPASVGGAGVNESPSIDIFLPPFNHNKLSVAEMPRVEIEVKQGGPGVVAFLRNPGGGLRLVRECRMGSVIVPVESSCKLVIADNTKSFNDVAAGSWYDDSVSFVTARGIFNGDSNTTFSPGGTMTRAMVAQVMYNYDRDSAAGDGNVFDDVAASDWYSAAVGWASETGIIGGYDGIYAPLDAITRQDLVTILYRYAKGAGYDVSAKAALSAYPDADDVGLRGRRGTMGGRHGHKRNGRWYAQPHRHHYPGPSRCNYDPFCQ